MMTGFDPSGDIRVPIALIHDVAVATAQAHLEEPAIAAFREDILAMLARHGLRAVVIDLSNVSYLDRSEFDALRATIRTIELMGARAVVVGIRPAVAASLVALEADLRGVVTALTVDRAFETLAPAETAIDADAADGEAHAPERDAATPREVDP